MPDLIPRNWNKKGKLTWQNLKLKCAETLNSTTFVSMAINVNTLTECKRLIWRVMSINSTGLEIASFFTRLGHATMGRGVILFMNSEIMRTLTSKVKCSIRTC